MNRTVLLTLGFAAIGAVATGVTLVRAKYGPPPPPPVVAVLPPTIPLKNGPPVVFLPIRTGDNLDTLLESAGIGQDEKTQVVEAVSESFDVRQLRAGSYLSLTRSASGDFESLEYVIDPDRRLEVSATEAGYSADVVEVPGEVIPAAVCTSLEGSLFESIDEAGGNPDLALRMASIFAWDIDFYTDPQEGDAFCVLVEKKVYENGQPPTFQRILAARYLNNGKLFDAFLFIGPNGKPAYYSRDGRSLQAAFLRSPMKFEAAVSSHFSHRRFHPVLKIYRPHLGTDYAAPTGTPVQAVADGTVVFSGYARGGGNWIHIRHANGYETQYLHLSRRFVKKGEHVDQGERIGLVGSTGLATGPHLDFRVRRNGKYVNFEALDMPRAATILAQHRAEFTKRRDRYRTMMDDAVPQQVALALP
jgi:murein DD-endopeptidase MepM/ murein hydrolase activator NlpD